RAIPLLQVRNMISLTRQPFVREAGRNVQQKLLRLRVEEEDLSVSTIERIGYPAQGLRPQIRVDGAIVDRADKLEADVGDGAIRIHAGPSRRCTSATSSDCRSTPILRWRLLTWVRTVDSATPRRDAASTTEIPSAISDKTLSSAGVRSNAAARHSTRKDVLSASVMNTAAVAR